MWIDSHCHLNHENIKDLGSPADIIEAARAEGVEGMLTINCRMVEEFPEILKIAEQHENVWCTLGTHPHDASKAEELAVTKEEMVKRAAQHQDVIGIGETGLDYHYDFSTPEDQQMSFRKHIQACIEADLPIIIHAREADEDVARILFNEEGAGTALKGVMHCFSSGRGLAEAALDFGFYISFSGIVTFKQADELRDIAKDVPLDRILVETDAPYLAPTPFRGKINQPAYVGHTGAVLAALHGISPEETAQRTTENFFRLFDQAN